MTDQQKAAATLTLLTRATFQLSEMDAVREVVDWLQSMAAPAPPAPQPEPATQSS